jgi:hypothetical protein
MTPTSTKATMNMSSHHHHPSPPTSGSFSSSAGHNASSTSSSSSPKSAASWRKPGQKLRQQVLDRDRVVHATKHHASSSSHHMLQQLDQECAISRYYDVCDKVRLFFCFIILLIILWIRLLSLAMSF